MDDTCKWLSQMKTNATFQILYICVCMHKNLCNNHACIFAKKSHIYVFRYMHALFYLLIFVNRSILVCEILENIKVHRFLCMHFFYLFPQQFFLCQFLKMSARLGCFFVLFCLIDSTGTCGIGVRILFKRMEAWREKKNTDAAIRRLLLLIGEVTQVGDSGFHLSHSLLSCLIPRTIPVRNTL